MSSVVGFVHGFPSEKKVYFIVFEICSFSKVHCKYTNNCLYTY